MPWMKLSRRQLGQATTPPVATAPCGIGRRRAETTVPLSGAWTEWEPATGQADTPLVVVRTSAVKTAAAGLAILAVLLIWRPAGRASRTRLALLTLMLGTTGLALWWLPTALQPLGVVAIPGDRGSGFALASAPGVGRSLADSNSEKDP